jgi:hypothetical protein
MSLFTQHFEGAAEAPSRSSLAPFVAVGAGAEVDFSAGLYAGIDVAAQTHFVPLQTRAAAPTETEVALAVGAGLALGKRF